MKCLQQSVQCIEVARNIPWDQFYFLAKSSPKVSLAILKIKKTKGKISILRMSYMYNWQATTSKLYVSKTQCILVRTLLRNLFTYSVHSTYSQATPRLLNVCVTDSTKFATNQLWVSRSSTIVFSFTWSWRPIYAMEDIVEHLDSFWISVVW